MLHARTTLSLLFFLVNSPEQISKPNFYALHNFLIVWNILIIFGRDIDKDQKRCHMQERQLFFFFIIYLSPLKPKSCAGHNSQTEII